MGLKSEFESSLYNFHIEKITDEDFLQKFHEYQNQRNNFTDFMLALPDEEQLWMSHLQKLSDNYKSIEIYLMNFYEKFKSMHEDHSLAFETLVKTHSKKLDNFGKIALLAKFIYENFIDHCAKDNLP